MDYHGSSSQVVESGRVAQLIEWVTWRAKKHVAFEARVTKVDAKCRWQQWKSGTNWPEQWRQSQCCPPIHLQSQVL